MRYSRDKKRRIRLVDIKAVLSEINLKLFGFGFALLVLLSAASWLWQNESLAKHFQFRHIKVLMSSQVIPPKQVAALVQDNLKGSFFSLNTRDLQTILLAQPWVESASFRRLWPDTLQVSVVLKKPVARWGKEALISEKGTVFSSAAEQIPPNLVRLLGPDKQASAVLDRYREMQALLSPLQLNITSLELTARDAWQVVMNHTLTVMLGDEQVMAKLQRFMALYSQIIAANKDQALVVDLRYPNGAAIQWAHPKRHKMST